MNQLHTISTAELEAEVERRYAEAEKPNQVNNPDLTHLRDLCQKHIDSIATNRHGIKDAKHYIFESTMTALYGSRVWDFINHYAVD